MVRANPRRRPVRLTAGAAALIGAAIVAGNAGAETARTIRIIVPLAPGGAGSVVAHVLADEIAAAHHVTTVVENRPGGGSAIGTEAAAGAPPDGNTVLITYPNFLTNPLLHKLTYDPLKSFEPVCKIADQPNALVVRSDSPYRNLNDFVAAARAKPGELTVATYGVSIPLEEFKRRANIDLTFVPYPGSSPAVAALLGGHIVAVSDNLATTGEHVRSGKLRALATFAPARIDGWPELPTFAEAGYNEYASWWGLFAPAKTPQTGVSELIAWAKDAMQRPNVKQKLAPLGIFPTATCGADFATVLRKQYEDFGRVIRDANIKVE